MSDISLDIRLTRGDFRLEVNTALPGDRITGIFGPSGSGKTSLLYTIAGLLRPEPGSAVTLGADVLQDEERWQPPHLRDITCVFQDGRLFPHLSVAGNLAYAWRRRRRDGPSQADVAGWLQLESLLDRRPQDLSRGQQQRVAIARALLGAPRLLLLDEPLANIDTAGRRDILARIADLRDRVDMAMIYVSHDMAELAELADQLLVLGDGRLVAQGPLLELSSRIELALAQDEQAAAIVSARVSKHDEAYGLTELSLEGEAMFVGSLRGEPGTAVRLRLPARDISLCRIKPEQTSILNVLPARIVEIERDGPSRVLVRLAVGEQHLLARVTRKSLDSLGLAVGDPVYAQVKSAALLSDTRTVDE